MLCRSRAADKRHCKRMTNWGLDVAAVMADTVAQTPQRRTEKAITTEDSLKQDVAGPSPRHTHQDRPVGPVSRVTVRPPAGHCRLGSLPCSAVTQPCRDHACVARSGGGYQPDGSILH